MPRALCSIDFSDYLVIIRGHVDRLALVSTVDGTCYMPVEIKQRAQPVAEDWAQFVLLGVAPDRA